MCFLACCASLLHGIFFILIDDYSEVLFVLAAYICRTAF
jgi:hypothetical protein